jgi:reductive dehalogenase
MAENYEVLESYKRFNQKNTASRRCEWDPDLNHISTSNKGAIKKHIEKGHKGFGHREYAVWAGSSPMTKGFASGLDFEGSGLTSWNLQEGDRGIPKDVGKYRAGEPARMREEVEKVARYFGADLVGFTELDERWIYTNHSFQGRDPNPPVELPEGCREAIVFGVEMDYEMVATAPAATMLTESHRSYSRMCTLISSVANYIKSLGYQAIPSLNDTAMNVPLAVDAGLGQPSRMGLVITPQFGPRVRLGKVITDLPLAGKKNHVDFGVLEFCDVCQKCAKRCPAGAAPTGPRTTEGHNISNSHGVLKWYLNAEKCRTYQFRTGTNCSICMRICPFNKGKGFHHSIARWMVKNLPVFNRFLIHLDEWLNYGKRKDSGFFWA